MTLLPPPKPSLKLIAARGWLKATLESRVVCAALACQRRGGPHEDEDEGEAHADRVAWHLEVHRALLLDDANLTDVVALDGGEARLLSVGAVALVRVAPGRHRR